MKRSKKNGSIRSHIFTLFLILLVLQVLFMFIIGYYLSLTARERIEENEQNKLQLYGQNMEQEILALDGQLRELCYSIYQLETSETAFPDFDFYLKSSIYDLLKYQMNLGSKADLIFVYSEQRDIMVSHKSARVTTTDNLQAIEYMHDNRFSPSVWSGNSWEHICIGTCDYLYTAKKIGDVTTVYACDIRTLMGMTVPETEEGDILLLDGSEQLLYRSGETDTVDDAVTDSGQFRLVQEIDGTDVQIVEFLDRKHLTGWVGVQGWIIGFGGIGICMLVVLFWYLSANVVAPIGELVDAMHGGGDGSLRKVSDKKNLSKEFGILYSSYNEMISEIADLKIAEYEKQLELQNEKIIGLMSQIKPHFYLNAISTIQGMTYQHREEDIRAFIQNLSKYLRYTFNSHERDVSLQEELESCQSYIEMQKIRFPGKIFYFCETAEVNMREIKVAPLILHTLIENCFKHAQDPQEILTILMRISGKTESDGTKGTEIILEDNGQGFPDNILKEQGNCRKKESGIGLYNIRRILELTYARTDLFEISNTIPHGARVRIFLPERKEKNIL